MEKNDNVSLVVFHGYKNSELVYSDNDSLRNFMIFLEWDETVWTYHQPNLHMVLKWRENEQMYINIDFQVERTGGRMELVHLIVGEQFDEEVWSRAGSYARAFNMEFVPFRVMDIIEEPRCSNLQMLWQDAHLKILSIHAALVKKFFCEEPLPNIEKLRNALTACGFDSRLAHTLIFHKAVMAEIENNRINEKTIIKQNLDYKVMSSINKSNSSKDESTFF